jgi:hypothetical protein
MCCSFSVIQGARVEISTDASNFPPHINSELLGFGVYVFSYAFYAFLLVYALLYTLCFCSVLRFD